MKYTEFALQCDKGKFLATLSSDIQYNINRIYSDVDENFDFESNPQLHPDYFVDHTLMIWEWSDVVEYVTEHYGLAVDEIKNMDIEEVVCFVELNYFLLGEQDGFYYFLKG